MLSSTFSAADVRERLLPHEFPPWKTVYHYFRCWRISGQWQVMLKVIREQVRTKLGRQAIPSAGIIDAGGK